jgi:hypothetical protein
MSVISSAARRHRQDGPPLGVLALVSAGLLLLGLLLSAALGGTIPSPFTSSADITAYFRNQPDAVRASAVLTFGSAVPLAIYAATASARLRRLGITAPGATIALAGGLVSAAMLAFSGLLTWTLSQPVVRQDGPLVRALHDLAFLTGGVAHVVFLGLLVAGVAVPGLILGLMPRGFGWAGLVIAVVAEIATVSLIWNDASLLVPIARFPALIWLIAAGFLLPRRRPARSEQAA